MESYQQSKQLKKRTSSSSILMESYQRSKQLNKRTPSILKESYQRFSPLNKRTSSILILRSWPRIFSGLTVIVLFAFYQINHDTAGVVESKSGYKENIPKITETMKLISKTPEIKSETESDRKRSSNFESIKQENLMRKEHKKQREVTASHLHDTKARAPWDPIAGSGRGHSAFEKHCHAEINQTGCQDTLPLDVCLRMKVSELSEPCSFVLNACQSNRRFLQECREVTTFGNIFTHTETSRMENMLALVDQASSMSTNISDSTNRPLDYWMTAGSMIGSLAHHGMIPWDDDVDIYVRAEHMDTLFKNIESLGLSVSWLGFGGIEKRTFKIYNQTLAPIPGNKHTYPFIDFFPVDCSDGLSCIEFNSAEKHSVPIDLIFPLKRRPFGRLSMPFPAKVRTVVENRYGSAFKKLCKKGAYNHKRERFTGRQNYHTMNCSNMILPPPFVSDQFDNITHHTLWTAAMYTPWAEDFPDLTVEHILNDGGKRLSSVVYDNGNEIRRSYADGLFQVDGNAITYNIPSLLPNLQRNLFPFLFEERLSFRSNTAGRSAKEINLEILPVLDRVVVSNKYGFPSRDVKSADFSVKDSQILHVAEWNVARGLDWDVMSDFYPISDIIILNEMDWGMARSGNRDTTKDMAKSFKMNYAYGVEFLELTNGNKEEINATVGKSNLIGYHGNAVLTKWPIVESKIVRLHPLYDLLFVEKTSGMAKGERRLGGRMALFTLIQTGDFGDLLAISIHAHSGSKNNLLKEDAKLVCDEIKKYSTTNVIIGGDIASPIPQNLVSDCGFFALEKTNSKKDGKGSRLTPSWRVVCPDGNMPRTARYPTRGDYILVKGPGFDVDSNMTKTNTIYPYRKHEGNDGAKPWLECVSDHALLSLDIELRKKAFLNNEK